MAQCTFEFEDTVRDGKPSSNDYETMEWTTGVACNLIEPGDRVSDLFETTAGHCVILAPAHKSYLDPWLLIARHRGLGFAFKLKFLVLVPLKLHTRRHFLHPRQVH